MTADAPRAWPDQAGPDTAKAAKRMIMEVATRHQVSPISITQMALQDFANWMNQISPNGTPDYLKALGQMMAEKNATGDFSPETLAQFAAANDRIGSDLTLLHYPPGGRA